MYLLQKPTLAQALVLDIITNVVKVECKNILKGERKMKEYLRPVVLELSELYGRGNNTCTSSGSGNNNNPCNQSGR